MAMTIVKWPARVASTEEVGPRTRVLTLEPE